MQTFDLIKNPVKTVLVMCLILCSKFAKNRLSAELCLDPLGGGYSAPLEPLAGSWRKGGGGEKEGQEGREVKEQKGRGEGRGGREEGRDGYTPE